MAKRGSRKRGPVQTTAEYRAERRKRCLEYILKAPDLPTAKNLAKLDHFGANTSVWLTAYGDFLRLGIDRH
jgi:hypothetical protein